MVVYHNNRADARPHTDNHSDGAIGRRVVKIAVVHSFYKSSEPSGENAAVMAQMQTLRAMGNEVSLVSRETDVELAKPLYGIRAALAAAGIAGPSPLSDILEHEPDIIHVHNLFPNFGTKWTERISIPLVTTAHNYRPFCAAASLFRDGDSCDECLVQGSHRALVHKCYRDSRLATTPLAWATRQGGRRNRLLQNCAKVVTLNHTATELFSKVVGPSRVVEVPNFVQACCDDRTEEPRNEGYLFVGRLTEEKGIHWLVKNWQEEKPPLTVVGTGPLQSQIARLADSRRNVFFLGQVPHNDVVKIMFRATAVIIPSLWLEGIPTVALEAYAAGTPVVISQRCGAAQQLARNGAGIIFDPSDGPKGLAAALLMAETNTAARRTAAEQSYREEYSPETWWDRMRAVYESTR